jgi:hypothetical protein
MTSCRKYGFHKGDFSGSNKPRWIGNRFLGKSVAISTKNIATKFVKKLVPPPKNSEKLDFFKT